LLEVHGESMINIGIMDGDLIAVHKTEVARNGQIVVARVEDNVTVKRYQKTRNKVTLLAENDDFDPIEVNLKETNFAIEGLYVGVIRRN
jgi:repressor LexA